MATMYRQVQPNFLQQKNWQTNYNGHVETNEDAALQYQPYRTTPLVLPGAKVQHDKITESYLRHHPNPQMRAGPMHDYTDVLMKQKVADSVLHRVVGPQDDVVNGKVVHKQFNSPIGLYSDNNIEHTIKQTFAPPGSAQQVPQVNGTLNRHPTKIDGYKKTVQYDPSKSETFKALNEFEHLVCPPEEQGLAPVETRVFQPNRCVPGKKAPSSFPPPQPVYRMPTQNDPNEIIHQSGSFKRLMYHVLGETDY